MDKYQIISEARTILELPESATMEQIKANYRGLIKKWHPDNCSDKLEICEKMSRKMSKENLKKKNQKKHQAKKKTWPEAQPEAAPNCFAKHIFPNGLP